MLVNLSEMVFDNSIYPREKWNSKTIEVYADAVKAGSKFPPIVLEKGTNRLLDGIHRWKAYLRYREMYTDRPPVPNGQNDSDDWPEPSDTIEVEYHAIPGNVPAKLYAASLSAKHGDRITSREMKILAREIFEANPGFSITELTKYLPRSRRTVRGYVSDLVARRKEEELMVVFRLERLGWTSREVSKSIRISQTNYQEEFLNAFGSITKSVQKSLRDGHPRMDVAERHNMPIQLVWAIGLTGKTDAVRMGAEQLNINVQPYDVWIFGQCHTLFGSNHPGRIPGQLVAQVMYFFTSPGDLVLDPMGGSGTTNDVALAMGRKCYSYDIDDRHKRSDIIVHNMQKDGWPDRVKKADLIFWDPPYFEKMDSNNIGKDGYIEGSISKLPRDKYLAFFLDRFTEARSLVKNGTKLAFLMSDWDDNTGEREGIFIWDYAKIIQESGWKLTRHIQVPLSTQQVHPDIVTKFRKSKRLARLERYLLIAEAK